MANFCSGWILDCCETFCTTSIYKVPLNTNTVSNMKIAGPHVDGGEQDDLQVM